jgi:hypothetical protein
VSWLLLLVLVVLVGIAVGEVTYRWIGERRRER